MLTRIFNLVTIATLLTFILFVTAFFFLGSKETFDKQSDELPRYFLGRTVVGAVLGIVGCIVVAMGNLLLDKGDQAGKRTRIFRVVLLTLLLSILTSVIGAGIFFFH